jgi:hypothetical protein
MSISKRDNRIGGFKCDVCGESFSSSVELNKHKLSHARKKEPILRPRPTFGVGDLIPKCKYCGKSFMYAEDLIEHEKVCSERP